jgi:hypothetical protein
MIFKIFTAILVLLVAGETLFFVMNRRSPNRFKPVEGYDGLVAFDTATGQLCKTLRSKSASQIEREAKVAKTEEEREPCTLPPVHSGDPVLDAMESASRSKRCGGDGVSQKSDLDASRVFIAGLPYCANIH